MGHELSDLVSNLVIAQRLNVSPPVVSNWVARNPEFPAPLDIPGVSSPIYSWEEVSAWHEGRAHRPNTVTTWADDFGLWHARITLGVPAPSDALNSASLRGSARYAIKREIELRQSGKVGRLRLFVVANSLDSMNRIISITYKEA